MADITSLKQEYSELMQKAKNIQEQIKNFNKKNTNFNKENTKVVIGSPSSMEFKNAIEQRDPIAYNWKTQIINTDYDYKRRDPVSWMEDASITIRPSIKNDNTNSNNSYKVLSYIRIDSSDRNHPLIINYGDIKYISKSKIKHEIGCYHVNYGSWGVNSVINACLSFGPSINYKE